MNNASKCSMRLKLLGLVRGCMLINWVPSVSFSRPPRCSAYTLTKLLVTRSSVGARYVLVVIENSLLSAQCSWLVIAIRNGPFVCIMLDVVGVDIQVQFRCCGLTVIYGGYPIAQCPLVFHKVWASFYSVGGDTFLCLGLNRRLGPTKASVAEVISRPGIVHPCEVGCNFISVQPVECPHAEPFAICRSIR